MYTTSAWDGTSYRPRISGDVESFVDASSWSTQQIVEHIVQHKIHIRTLKGVPAQFTLLLMSVCSHQPGWIYEGRPKRRVRSSAMSNSAAAHGISRYSRCRCVCVQSQQPVRHDRFRFTGWCDYIVCDPISCPPEMCATERWRMKRRETSTSSSQDTPASHVVPLDLYAEIDPEEESDEWVL